MLTQKQLDVLSTMQIERSAKATAQKLEIPLSSVYSRIYRIQTKTGYNIVYPDQLKKCAVKYGQCKYNSIISMSINDMADVMSNTFNCDRCPIKSEGFCIDISKCKSNCLAYLKAK